MKKSYNAECLLSLSQRRSNSTSASSQDKPRMIRTAKKTTQLQPKDPPTPLAQESQMWSSPRTSRFPDTSMAPPRPEPSFWQPARRSTAPGSTKPSPCKTTQEAFKGRRRATTARSPWKWTVSEKKRLCSRKSVTPPGEFLGVKTGKREPVTSSLGAYDEKCCCDVVM